MKRLTSLILAAVLALSLLSSCGGNTPEISGAPSGAPEASSAPEANYLADPIFDTDEYLPDYDMDNRFLQAGTRGRLVETANAYYLVPSIPYIMFVDKQSLLCGPLCGKPECAHNDIDCNAYIDAAFCLSRYDGKLYFASGDTLYKMDLDGTNREQVLKFGQPSYINDSGGSERVGSTVNYKVSLHRGYIYRTWMEYVVNDGVPGVRMYAESIKTDSGERTAIFDRTYPGNNAVDTYQIRFSGNHLYMMLKKYTEETRTYSFELYDWDSKTRRMTALADGDISASDFWVGDDGYIYIGCKDSSLADNPNVIYRFTPEGRTLELYREFETQPSLMGDGVLFLAPARSDIDSGKSAYTATFADWDGNVLFYGSILPDGVSNENMVGLIFLGGDSEKVFLEPMWRDGTSGIVRITLGDEPKAELLWKETEEGQLVP